MLKLSSLIAENGVKLNHLIDTQAKESETMFESILNKFTATTKHPYQKARNELPQLKSKQG